MEIDCQVLILRELLAKEAEKCNDAELLDLLIQMLKTA
mgnify:CR=1 FL=1